MLSNIVGCVDCLNNKKLHSLVDETKTQMSFWMLDMT